MLFQLNVTLTEDDYLNFNRFHAMESKAGKKQIRNTRIFFICLMLGLMAFLLIMVGWTSFSTRYLIFLGAFSIIYMLLLKKILNRNIKANIKRLKKTGKFPFDSTSTIEFYEDKLVEITASRRIEQSYSALERICVVRADYILLYNSSVGAYILPIPQIDAQLNRQALLSFLSQKCTCIEYYEKA